MYDHISKNEIKELKEDHWNWLGYQEYHVGDLNCHWIVFKDLRVKNPLWHNNRTYIESDVKRKFFGQANCDFITSSYSYM